MKKILLISAACVLSLLGGMARASVSEIGSAAALSVQQAPLRGTVVDQNGAPVVGATVLVPGTTNGTTTDANGNFVLAVPEGTTLQVSSLGYETVTVNASRDMRMVIREDSKLLSESVVVGFGTQRKENLTGAVASVNVENALGSRPVADVGRGLQGAAPGLNVRIGTNEVGSDPILRIRGQVGSLNGSSSPLILLDNVEIPSISLINPDDIESISVLKDAASASIYGAKAAFGVILITSKKGSKESEKVSITYSGNLSFQNIAKDYQIADVDALHYTVEAAERTGTFNPVGAFWLIDRAGYNAAVAWKEKYGSTLDPDSPMTYGRDWYLDGSNQKIGVRTYDPYHYMVRRNAPTQTHNVAIAGSKGRTDYNISLGYLNQTGMMKPTKFDYFKRYNANVRVNSQINDWLGVHAGIMFTKSEKAWSFATNSTTADTWYYLFRWGPTYPLVPVDEYGNNVRTAAYELATAHKATNGTTYSSVNVGTTITPLPNWNINVDYTYANNNTQERDPGITYWAGNTWTVPAQAMDANGSPFSVANEWNAQNKLGETLIAQVLKQESYTNTYNFIYQDSFTSQRQTWNVTSTYDWNLLDAHKFRFMVGLNAVAYDYTGVWGKKMDLININNPQFALASGTQTTGGSDSWSSTIGFFGRLNYNFKERYLLEANLRYDGSSKFPTELKWRWFPSVSAGWRVTEEPWMMNAKSVLSSLKLRASWGTIGDQTVPSSLYIPTMSAMSTYWIHNGALDTPFNTPGLVTADITWQDIQTLDFGVDFSLFNQINVTFDWFRRKTLNMIVGMEGFSYNIGTANPQGNYGDLRTDGWEFSVNYGHVFGNGLSLSATASLSDAKSIITRYGNATGINGWYNGKTYGEIWGYKVDRLYQNDDFAYDANGKLIQVKDKYGIYYKFAEGKEYASQGRFQSGSLIPGPGDVKFQDLNGDGIIDWGLNKIDDGNPETNDHGDLTVIGNTTPRYEYSLRLDAGWKGVDLSVFFQGIGKRDMWGSSPLTIPGFNSSDGAMPQTIAGDFWYETKDDQGKVIDSNYDAFYPRAANLGSKSTGFTMQVCDKYLLNMAYFRVKNITLGYTIPARITQKIQMAKARVYISLENYFTFDHLRGLPLDPEEMPGYSYLNSSNYNLGRAGVGTPAFKSASAGLQITF